MFHACPEIHGHCSKLYLHRKVFHPIQTIYRHSYDYMITSITIWLRTADIIPFFYHDQVTLAFQKFCQIIDIIYKVADHSDTCNILQIIFGIDHGFFFSFSAKFIFNTSFLFDPALDIVDRSCRGFSVKIVVQHIQTGKEHLLGIFIWSYKFIIFFICHFSFLL